MAKNRTGQKTGQRRPRPERPGRTERIERDEDVIVGRNPVTEALKSGRTVEKLYVQQNAGGSLGRVIQLAKEKGVPVMETGKAALDKMAAGLPHQGVAAAVTPYSYADLTTS